MNIHHLIEQFHQARKRLLLLDYDGTLVKIAPTSSRAIPSAYLMEVLRTLCQKENTTVCIITGRSQKSIKKMLGNLPVKIIAEHGAGVPLAHDTVQLLRSLFARAVHDCTGSFVEEKRHVITWHYRNAENGWMYAQQLLESLHHLRQSHPFKLIAGKKVLEVMDESAGKGNAIKPCLAQELYDFILCAGDDATDEEMFCEVNRYTYTATIKIGKEPSRAKWRLASPDELVTLLAQL